MAPGNGGATSGSIGPVEEHPANPGEITAQARTLANQADQTIDERAVTEKAFSPAIANWDGIAAPELRQAPDGVRRSAAEVARNLAWLPFPLQRWASVVQAFNSEVRSIKSKMDTAIAEAGRAKDANGEPLSDEAIADKRQEARSQAVAAWHKAYEKHITNGAAEVASMIKRGPTADNIRKAAGIPALGWAPFALFRVPDDPSMPMLPPPLTGADGRRAAEMVQRALDGRAGPEEFKDGMALLRMVSDHAQYAQENGIKLSDGELAFLTAFYGTLGKDIYRLPDYIRADEHKYDENGRHFLWWGYDNAPGFSEADQKWMMSAAGAGILALSDEKLGGGFQDDQHPYGLPKDLYELLHDPAVTSKLETIGTSSYVTVEGTRLDDLGALADLVHAAPPDMHGGTRFSELVTQRVAEISNIVERHRTTDLHSPGLQLLVEPDLAKWGSDDHHLRHLLDVSTRNHQANYNLLTGATNDPMARIGTYVDDPVYTMDNRKFLISSLFGKEWSDDGKAAGGLVDWIGDDSLKSGEQGARAREAYTSLTNLLTDDTKFQMADGQGGKVDTNFFKMMADDMVENGAISTALARATQPNIGLFAHPLDSGDTQWNHGDPQLSDHDASRMMMLAQYTQEGRNHITIASQAYKFDLLDQVHKGEISMATAGQYAGNIDGYATAGAENAIWQKNVGAADKATEEARQAYFDRVMYSNVVKGFISFGAGRVGDAGPYLSQAVDRSADLMFGLEFRGPPVIKPEQLPQDLADTPLHTPQGAVNTAAYDLAAYERFRGGDFPAQATWLDSDGDVVARDARGQVRVADPMEVTDPDVKRHVAEWANGHYKEYMTGYDTHANDVYQKNSHTESPEDIRNYMEGGR